MTTYYTWRNDPRLPNCPVCQALEGKTLARETWEMFIMPGWHRFCDCYLEFSSFRDDGNNPLMNDPIIMLLYEKFNNTFRNLKTQTGRIVGSNFAMHPGIVYSTQEPESYVGSTNHFLRVPVGKTNIDPKKLDPDLEYLDTPTWWMRQQTWGTYDPDRWR